MRVTNESGALKFKVLKLWKGDFKDGITLVTGAFIQPGGLVVSYRGTAEFSSNWARAIGSLRSTPKIRCSLPIALGRESSQRVKES